MNISDVALIMSLIVGASAVVLIALFAPLQRKAMRELVDRNRLDMMTLLDEFGTTRMQLESVDSTLRRLIQRVDHLQLAQGGNQVSYQRALGLSRGGASADQLIEQCGLTRVEAQLLQRLHPPATAAADVTTRT